MSDRKPIHYEIHFCRPIPGYNDKYFVSDKGSIFSNAQGKIKPMHPRLNISGYLAIILHQKTKQVHILVASAWLKNPLELPFVNHKDGNKINNAADNLEYVTQKENVLHARKVLGRKPYHRILYQLSQKGTLIREYQSIAEAERVTGINSRSICLVCQGKRRKAGEYVWCYKENYKGESIRNLAQCKRVSQYDLNGAIIKRYESVKDAARAVGALESNISNACSGRLQTCKGFRWKYEEKISKVDETTLWKTLNEYPLYKISRNGEIYSTWVKKMKKQTIRGGYKLVSVTNISGEEKKMFVHRLVALAYISNPNNYPIVNHKDGDPSNNSVENLEWCTYSQNSQHAHDIGLNKAKKAVVKMDTQGNILSVYKSMREAAQSIGLSPDIISRVCRGAGRNKKAGGYRWAYA